MPDSALDLAAALAKPFEGLRLDPYHCPANFPTIGYGHLLSRVQGADLRRWQAITENQAHDLLEKDMASAAASVARLINVPLSDHQRAALIDFTFNLGGGSLQVSTLRRVINRGELHDAPAQFMRWVYATVGRGPVKLPGLVRRRAAEVDYWLSG